MSKRYVLHVVPNNPSGWAVKEAGASRPLQTFTTKQPATDWAVARAKANQPSQVVVHRSDGTIEFEWTYGSDPYPPIG